MPLGLYKKEVKTVHVTCARQKGLRVITSGGVSCGMDASMWLVNAVAGRESAEKVLDLIQYAWRQGVVL